ncbi:uncharacterized protein METZ01_LOCUS380718, partial [marine metagenome]
HYNMIDLRGKVREIIHDGVKRLGYELIDVECQQEKESLKIIIYIDHVNGIQIDDCVTITNNISPIIDENIDLIERYSLEVSSPGLNRKLILKEHYDKFIGKDIKVKLKTKIDNRKIYKGTLLERAGDSINIFENNQKISIHMDTIEICRLIPSFE